MSDDTPEPDDLLQPLAEARAECKRLNSLLLKSEAARRETIPAPPAGFAGTVMQEVGAGLKIADVFNSSDIGHYVLLKKKGMLAKYAPAGAQRFPESFRDPEGIAFGWRAFLIVMSYNTKLLASADAPKTWKDILDPKWKGKLVTAHPGYSGSIASYMLALVKLYGWDYFKQLAQNKPQLSQSVHDPAQVFGHSQ